MGKNAIRFHFNNMFRPAVGEHGLDMAAIPAAAEAVARMHAAMRVKKEQMAWRQLPYNQQQVVAEVKQTGAYIRASFDNFVVLGIGGSALGSKALFAACCHPRYNALSAERRGGPRFYVEDNVDPDRLQSLFDVIDIKRTAFHVISKSGNTVETMSQFILVTDLLQKAMGADFRRNIFVTTDKESGLMKKIADAAGWKSFVVPDGVGGRFSVLCPVGLLSAAVLGIDVDALLEGAAAMDKICTQPTVEENPAYLYALLYTEAMKQGVNISVMLPYADALAPFSEWYCQLWAESLGKAVDNQGKPVHYGQTPVRALGVTDQHSQIQLYNEGPYDKIITFIGVEHFRNTLLIPSAAVPVFEADYVCGHSFNELIAHEMQATIHAVTTHGKMNNCIWLESLNACTLGKLFFFFEMATAAAGELLQIDAFNQPGVEAGKVATFALMGRPGYEDVARQLSEKHSASESYVFHA